MRAIRFVLGILAGAALLVAIASHAQSCEAGQTQFVGAFNSASFVSPFAFQRQVVVQRQFVPFQRQVIVQRNFAQPVFVQRQFIASPFVQRQVIVQRPFFSFGLQRSVFIGF